MKYIIMIIYALMSNGALIVMKQGTNKGFMLSLKGGFISGKISYYSLTGFIMYIISFLIYIYLISKFNLTYIIPIASALSYIIIFIVSILFLKESLSLCQTIGFFVIMIGAVLMNIK